MPQKLSPEKQKGLGTSLINAALVGDTETVRILLAAGANVHTRSDEALWRAAYSGHTETVKALLAAGAAVHEVGDQALCGAAFNGHTETVKTLLAAGADVHASNDVALWWTVKEGHTETVKTLLAAGADVRAMDNLALCWAAYGGHMEIVRMLAKHIFAPDSWSGKNREEIEAQADTLYERIKTFNPANLANPELLRKSAKILVDCALDCWFQVRPAPPKLQISPLAAQPRPL